MISGETRTEWAAALADSRVDPETCVLFVVLGEQPDNTTESAYLPPNHLLKPDSPLVLRRVGEERVDDYFRQHKVAMWASLRHECAALSRALFLRHELHHIVQFEAAGHGLTDLREDLYDALKNRFGAAAWEHYTHMPDEQDANAAASAYAASRYPGKLGVCAAEAGLRQFSLDLESPDEESLPSRMITALRRHTRPEFAVHGLGVEAIISERQERMGSWPPGGLAFIREESRRPSDKPGVVLVDAG